MNFDNIELAAAELRNEPWVTPVSMNADPAVRAYLAAATPTRVHELVQIVKRHAVENERLVLELAAEVQRADMLLEQGKIAAAAMQSEQERCTAALEYAEQLKSELAEFTVAQQGGGELPQDERAVNVKEIHASVLAMRPDPKMTDAQRFAFTGAVHMAAAVVSQFARRAASVPATSKWVLVPRVPTQEMLKAAWEGTATGGEQESISVWDAMVNAASVAASVPAMKQTDLSKQLRDLVGAEPGAKQLVILPKTVLAAADEIDRYYTGMVNWKASAEAKDIASVPAQAGQQPTLLAYAATDLDGRVDVGMTPEKAKERAGNGCTTVFGLYDLGCSVPAASVQGGVDWLGGALELEAQAKKVESKSARRAMESGAHRLRLMGNNQPDIGRDAALEEAARVCESLYSYPEEDGSAAVDGNLSEAASRIRALATQAAPEQKGGM